MKKIIKKIEFLLSICVISNIAFAQSYQLNDRSAIGFNLGLFTGSKSANSVAIDGINSEVSSNGFAGNIFFSHWLQENTALTLSAGLLTGSSNVSVNVLNTTQQASTVIPILLGLNYYFLDPTSSDAIRPFISTSVGMYIGSEAKNTMISQQVHSETAMGGRAGIGIDFLISSHFILGANLGYNVMANFSNPIGGKRNFNGADFSFQSSYVF
jgi:outer membrane protein W